MNLIQALPPIALGPEDFHRLSWLAGAVGESMPDISAFLRRELARAEIVDPWFGLVTMGATVRYRRGMSSPEEKTGTLVYPKEACRHARPISILSEEGVALIGLREGQTIRWRSAEGALRCLTVMRSD